MSINENILDPLMGITIPPTPKLSCQLFGRFDANSGVPQAVTEEEKKCVGEPFHTTVSRLLHQAAPSLDIKVINTTIKAFFDRHHVENEDGLSTLVPLDDLPETALEPSNSLWQIVVFRRAMTIVIHGCIQFHLQPNTPYNLLLKHSRNGGTPSLSGSSTSTSSLTLYSVKTVASVTLASFSGLTCDFKEWHDTVQNAYGKCGHQIFLDDEAICTTYDAVSYSIKCNLSTALSGGTLAYLSEELKNERNAFLFLQGIRREADAKADHRNREFKQWLDLFTHKLDTPDSCYSFINKFSLSISALKEANSSAVNDDILLRALLLQSIQCEEFADVKLEITKDLDMKPNDIIKSLKAHQLALDSEETLNDSRGLIPSQRTIRRGNMNDSKDKFGDTKPIFRVPKWPRGLYEVCTRSLWKQLGVWKMLVNKDQLNEHEEKKLRDFTIHSDQPRNDDRDYNSYRPNDRERSSHHSSVVDGNDRRPPSGRDRYPTDRRRSGANDYDTGDKRKRDTPPQQDRYQRSAKTNRHSDDKRRVRRRSLAYESDTSGDFSVESNHSHIRSRRTNRADTESDDTSGQRILMGGVLRN